MPLDRRVKRLLDMLAATAPDTGPREGPAARRQALADLARMVDDDSENVGDIEAHTLPGPAGSIPIRRYSPLGLDEPALPGLVFFHGGGWVAGGFETHDGLCRRLTNASGCRVIAVDYRLAPEHPFPAAIEDALAVVGQVAANASALGINATRLAVGGDSAGALLAASVCQAAKARGGPAIALQLLICPILSLAGDFASRRAYADGYFLNSAAMTQDLDDFCPPGIDRADPRLNPLDADLSGLPPAIVHVAEFDPFGDEGRAYAQRLKVAGVTAEFTVHDGMIHYFYAMPRAIPRALDAAAMIGAQIRAALARG